MAAKPRRWTSRTGGPPTIGLHLEGWGYQCERCGLQWLRGQRTGGSPGQPSRALSQRQEPELESAAAREARVYVMDETINFDAVSRRIVELTDLTLIREQLVLVWNARGAADILKIDVELSTLMGDTAGGPIIKHLDRALRTLDR